MDAQIIRLYLLQKQSLLEPKTMNDISELVHQQLGLHSTDYLTPYFSLFARIQDFDPAYLFQAINKFEFLRKRAYRGTVFVINKEIFPIINATSRTFAINWFKGFERELTKQKVDLTGIREKLINLFKEHQNLTVRDVKKLMAEFTSIQANWWGQLLRYYELDGLIVRTTHRYLLDKVLQYELVENIFPEASKQPLDYDKAVEQLFIQYLKQYGPLTIDDFCWWLPTTKTKAKRLISKFEDEIIELALNEQDCIIHTEDYDTLQKFNPPNDDFVHFLPYEDHFPKAYINRELFLPNELVPIMMGQETITKGQLWPSIWLNGQIIGKWEIEYLDKQKTNVEIKIIHLDDKKRTGKINDLIEIQRNNLEIFINEQLLPLNKKKK
jgi:hypothetical protein